jgi:hypothetical protein
LVRPRLRPNAALELFSMWWQVTEIRIPVDGAAR